MKNLIFSLLIIAFFMVSCSTEQPSVAQETTTTVATTDIEAASMEAKPMEGEVVLSQNTVQEDMVDNLNGNVEQEAAVVKAQLTSNSSTMASTTPATSERVNSAPVNKATSTTNNTPPPPPSVSEEVLPSTTKAVVKETTASNTPPPPPPPAIEKAVLSHDIFDGLLRKYVNSSGGVNYSGLKKEEAKLKAYLDLLAQNPPQSNWSKNKEMAYWINLYNAFTISTIVKEYPVKSVMDKIGRAHV